jgi:hypothetical protein
LFPTPRVVAEIEVEVVLNNSGLLVVPYASDTRNKGRTTSDEGSTVADDAGAVAPAAESIAAEHAHITRTNTSTFVLAAVDDDMSSVTVFKPLALLPSAPVAVALNISILIPIPPGLYV